MHRSCGMRHIPDEVLKQPDMAGSSVFAISKIRVPLLLKVSEAADFVSAMRKGSHSSARLRLCFCQLWGL